MTLRVVQLSLVLDEDLISDLVERRNVPPRAQLREDNLAGRGEVDVAERGQHDTLSYKIADKISVKRDKNQRET